MSNGVSDHPSIRGVGVLHAGLFGAIACCLFGILYAILVAAGMGFIASSMGQGQAGAGAPNPAAMTGIMSVVGFLCYGCGGLVMGFVGGAALALLYALAGMITGGIEIETSSA